MMKYARRDFPCIRGCIRPAKASLLKTPISNLLITRHKIDPNLQGTKPAVWLAVRSVSCKPVSPGFLRKSRGKLRGKIARVQGRVCGSVQARNFLPDSCFPCGTGLRSAGRERVLPGWQPALIGCQLRPCRPEIASRRLTPRPACLPADHPCMEPQTGPDRRAGLPDRCPSPAPSAHGPAPAIPVLPPANRTGPVKPGPLIDAATCRTRSAERVRDFRAQGTGFQGTGTSGGSRPVSGMRAGPERVPSREGFFAAGHAGPPDVFFTAGIPRIPARTLLRFPRAFQREFRFGREDISFQMTRRENFPQ